MKADIKLQMEEASVTKLWSSHGWSGSLPLPTYRICSIKRRSLIVAAPSDVLKEIVAALY